MEHKDFSLTVMNLHYELPTTTLSGCIKSLIAAPSFKNSGLETTLKVKDRIS